MAEWALVLTVGTTADPLKKAVEEAKAEAERESASLSVLLLYGRPLPNQHPDPFQIAAEVRQHAENLGLKVQPCEISEPEDLDICLGEMRRLLQRISNADKVIVNYTGGTKAMSAAIVHAALTTSFAGELELHYVGGAVRDKNGRVIREAMETRKTARTLTQERMEQILDLMKGHRYELAAYLAEGLPELGRLAFIKKASRSLLLWDNFAYEKAADGLRGLYQQAQGFVDDQRLGKLAETVRRLVSEVITPVLNTIRAFREWEKGKQETIQPEGVQLLCADILENASRHLHRQEWTETVLRSYRALEAAVQGALALLGLNPWCFDPSKLSLEQVQEIQGQLNYMPKELTLWSGIIVWQTVSGKRLDDEMQKWSVDLQQLRNRSILEHGYRACTQDDAQRALSYAEGLAAFVLGCDLKPLREKVSLQV
jgi:CRISPR-associated protein (TIGR02710 family)